MGDPLSGALDPFEGAMRQRLTRRRMLGTTGAGLLGLDMLEPGRSHGRPDPLPGLRCWPLASPSKGWLLMKKTTNCSTAQVIAIVVLLWIGASWMPALAGEGRQFRFEFLDLQRAWQFFGQGRAEGPASEPLLAIGLDTKARGLRFSRIADTEAATMHELRETRALLHWFDPDDVKGEDGGPREISGDPVTTKRSSLCSCSWRASKKLGSAWSRQPKTPQM